ncbi:MAG: HXXEE domain-containing protein [Planctomycetota bacterium]|jgi:hypothetical protein
MDGQETGSDTGEAGVSATSPLGILPRLTFACFILHVLEELPNFPDWASRHFARISMGDFIFAHVFIFAAVFYLAKRASEPRAQPAWILCAVALQWAFFGNVFFHAGTTILFGEYSPGLVTAILLYLPLTYAYVLRILRSRSMTALRQFQAFVLGMAFSALVTATLWLEKGFI